MYWDKNFAKFNFTNCVSYLPGSCGRSSRVAMRICACAHDRENVSKFSLCRKFVEKFSPVACIGEIGENFLLAKLSTYMVSIIIINPTKP